MRTYTLEEHKQKYGGTPIGEWCWGEGYITQCDCQIYVGNRKDFTLGFYADCEVCEGYGVPPIPLEELK